jgi:SWIM zinc finger
MIPQLQQKSPRIGQRLAVPRAKDKPRLYRGRQTRLRSGQRWERTELLPIETAIVFCAALEQLGSTQVAQVRRDHHAVPGSEKRHYVRWTRREFEFHTRGKQGGQAMQDIRLERAALQRNQMEFIEADKPGWWWCVRTYIDKPDCANLYILHKDLSCSCGDFEYRLAGTALRCKHQIALGVYLKTLETTVAPTQFAYGVSMPVATATDAGEREAKRLKVLADREREF